MSIFDTIDPILQDIKKMKREMDINDREVKQQMLTHSRIETEAPTASVGRNGDTKVVNVEGKVYQYIKVNNEWYKTELEKA